MYNIRKKSKVLYLLHLLITQSDENHPLSMSKIINELYAIGIEAERKSIYQDIKDLEEMGYDIVSTPKGYFLASPLLETAQARILIDALSSSTFLTNKKAEELQENILSLLSTHEAEMIRQQALLSPRHSDNEQVYYNLDKMQKAIHQDYAISFKYFDYNVRKKKIYRKNSKRYIGIPYGLIYHKERYYAVIYNPSHDNYSNYRIDKMDQVEIIEELQTKLPFDLQKHRDESFNMYTTTPETIRIEFDESLINVLYDDLGKDIFIEKIESGKITLMMKAAISDSLIAWILSFSTKAKVISPTSLIDTIRNYTLQIHNLYKEND